MMLTPTLTLSIAMLFAQPRLAERALSDVAVIQVRRSTKEMYKGVRDDQQGRLVCSSITRRRCAWRRSRTTRG
jgi:hypothetical protein